MANQTLTLTLWAGGRRASGISPGAVEETETLSVTLPVGFLLTDNPIVGLANALMVTLIETTGHADNGIPSIAFSATAPEVVITNQGGAGTTSVWHVTVENPHSING